MDASASDVVLQSRMSWGTYDKMRKTQGLAQLPKRVMSDPDGQQSKRRHGCTEDKLQFDKEGLLEECSTWSPTKNCQLVPAWRAVWHNNPKPRAGHQRVSGKSGY